MMKVFTFQSTTSPILASASVFMAQRPVLSFRRGYFFKEVQIVEQSLNIINKLGRAYVTKRNVHYTWNGALGRACVF